MDKSRIFRPSTHVFHYHIPTEYVLLAVLECIFLMFSLYLALETRYLGDNWEGDFGAFLPKAFLYAAIMQLGLVGMGVYQPQAGRLRDVLILRIAAGLLMGLIPLAASYYVAPFFFLGRGVIALSVIYSFVLIAIIRVLFFRVVRARDLWTRVLVLGSGRSADLVRKAQRSGELRGLKLVGYAVMPGDHPGGVSADSITLDRSLVDYVAQERIDEIVLAVDERREGIPSQDLIRCRMSGVEIMDLQTFFERRSGKIRLDILQPSWLYLSDGFRESLFRWFGKRAFDIAVVLLLLPLALPLMLMISIVILIESKGQGPIIYRQARITRNGKTFQIYKFRSMVPDAEGEGVVRWASENDPRITRTGAFLRKGRLDELPQLFNILMGDMSFVGPRPERPEFVEQLAEAIPLYSERHRVKPGLTGWAQIHYPYGASEEDARQKLQYDLYYVKNYSMLLDLLILLQTAEVVMLGKGAQ